MQQHTEISVLLGHPGHEFRIFELIRRHRPRINILAFGSRGGMSTDRVLASANLIRELGASQGNLFGVASDRDFYQAILACDIGFFEGVTRRFAESLVAQQVRTVVADSWQDYNPIHDLTHAIARASIAIAGLGLGRQIQFLDYPVVGDDHAPEAAGEEFCRINLSPEACAFKIAKMEAYPDIAADAEALISQIGPDAVGVEILRVPPKDAGLAPVERPPAYEQYGAERVRSGLYKEVLTRDHVARIAKQLAEPAFLNDLASAGKAL